MIIFYFSKLKVKQFVLMHLHQQEIRFQELLNKVKSIFCPAFRIKIINLPLKKLQNNINLGNCIWWWTYSKFVNFLNPTVIIIWIWMNLISLVENPFGRDGHIALMDPCYMKNWMASILWTFD